MKYIAIILMLLLVGCSEPIRGGNIVGKYTKLTEGIMEDTIQYYLQLQKSGQTGDVEVTEEAWNQAKSGLTWPFEVK